MRKAKKTQVTDLWFRTSLSLEELSSKLQVEDSEFDYENVYEWIIGSMAGHQIDISRNHVDPKAFTSIFVLPRGAGERRHEMPRPLQAALIDALRSVGLLPVYCGRAWIGKDDKFESELVRIVRS